MESAKKALYTLTAQFLCLDPIYCNNKKKKKGKSKFVAK